MLLIVWLCRVSPPYLWCAVFSVQELSIEFTNMDAINHEPENVLGFLILPFLRMNTEGISPKLHLSTLRSSHLSLGTCSNPTS